MKKIIIAFVLLIVAVFSVFYFTRCSMKCKKVDFVEILNKEFIYKNKNKPTDITITFSRDGLYGFAGVNRYFAGYRLEENGYITLSPIGSTMMAGTQEKMEAEREYFELLNEVDRIETYKTKIILLTKNNEKLKFIINKEKSKYPEEDFEMVGPETMVEDVKIENKDGTMTVNTVSNK